MANKNVNITLKKYRAIKSLFFSLKLVTSINVIDQKHKSSLLN